MSNKFLFFPIFGIALPVVLYFIFSDIRQVFEIVVPPVGDVAIETDPTRTVSIEKKSEKIVFVGDVLLARHVEFLLDTKPEFNPFKEVGAIFLDAPHVIGNFESAILESHKQTPSYVTIFSVDQKYLPRLREAGFTHLSLANNHSFDYGAETFSYTTKALKNTGLVPFGHPNLVVTTSATFFTSGDYTIGLLAINQIFTPMSLTDITTQLKALSLVSDYKIAYVHWGEEYNLKHNQAQQQFAHTLIDAGFDAVIGHHPHVTQDIEVYAGKPIFYSLGNFLFDQYFSVDVKQGLALTLMLSSSSAQYSVTPISSENSLSQPHLMSAGESALFLKNLSRRSDSAYVENIASGMLILPWSLATST